MTQNGDFSKGSIIKILMRLAIPMTLAQLMNVLYNVVDRMFIGRIGGDSMDALTGVGVCLPMITIVIAFANLVGMGGAPLFSIERGKKNEREAEYILGNCVVLFLIFAVVLTVAGLIFKRPLLMLLGASEVTLPYAEQYITIYLLGTIFVMFGLGLNNFINAQGFAKIGMCTTVIGAALNIALDPIFIFVLNMGVRGAAIATVISQAAAAVWTVRFLTGKKALIRIQRRSMQENYGTWSGRIYHVGHKLNGTDGVQRDAADPRRRCVCRHYDNYQFCAGDYFSAGAGIYQRQSAGAWLQLRCKGI